MNFSKFISTKNIRAVTLTLLWGLLSSCAQIDLPFSSSQDEGYLVINAPSIDISISSESLTKSGEITLSSLGHTIPSVDDFKYKIEGTTVSNEPVSNEYNSRPTETLVLKAGNYTLKVSYGDSPIGQQPYFYKEQAFTILPGQTASLNLGTVKMANSLIKVDFPDDLSLHLPTNSSKLTYQYNSVSHSDVVTTENWRFVPAGEVKLIISGTNSAGVSKELTFVQQAKPATAHTLSCSLNVPEISLSPNLQAGAFEGSLYFEPATFNGKVSNADKAKLKYQINGGEYSDWTDCAFVYEVTVGSNTYKYIKGLTDGEPYKLRACLGAIVSDEVSFSPKSLADCVSASATPTDAAHTTNDASELNGTRVTSTYIVSGIPSLAAKLITLTASGSTAKTSYSNLDLSKSGTSLLVHTNADGWPYIPQGSYTDASVVTCTFPEGNTATLELNQDINVPAPEFTVDLLNGSYTSYDKYATNDITTANSCNAETLYNLGASWTISQDLMTKTNYSKVLRFYDGTTVKKEVNTFSATQHTEQSITDFTWGAHTVKATVTFDGVEIESGPRTHHITGLPYRASPPVSVSTSAMFGWTNGEGNAQNWGSEYLQLGVHGSKQVQTAYKDFYIPSTINVSLSSKIAAHNAPVNTTCSILIGSATVMSVDSDGHAFNYKTTEKEDTVSTQMTTSANRVTLRNSYSVTSSWGRIYYVNILYR